MSSIALPEPTGNSRSKDHIFISYAHTDRALVERMAGDLRDRGYVVWIDFEGIRGGDIWKQSIVDGIYASAVFMFVISPDSLQSEWCALELQAAVESAKPILPLLVHPMKSAKEKRLFDGFELTDGRLLHDIQYRDFTLGYEKPLEELLKDFPTPHVGIVGHCKSLVAHLAASSWGLDHYVQEVAKMLPVNASPYEDGITKGESRNLLYWLHEKSRLIVLGEPGIGKTVALDRFAWELASSDPPILPIIVKLLEYDGRPLLEWIRLNIVRFATIDLSDASTTKKFLETTSDTCFLLLDGLNEVPHKHRETVVNEITRLGMEFPKHTLVITSRVQDESWRRFRHGSVPHDIVVIQPIREDQAADYLIAHLGESDGVTLWNQLDSLMRQLATTPLLLWLIKEAWLEARQRKKVGYIKMPENRGELYKSFVQRILRRDDERQLSKQVSATKRLVALEQLALFNQRRRQLAIDIDKAEEIVGNDELLSALRTNGFLWGDLRLRFAPHQTMQEHFAAQALIRESNQPMGKKLSQILEDLANDSWWAETCIQMAGLTIDPNELASTIAKINPWLAWWCAQEGRKVEEETLKAIEASSIALVHSPEVTDRRQAAQALAKLQTPRVLAPLCTLAVDADEEVGRIAVETLLPWGESVDKWLLVRKVEKPELVPSARLRLGLLIGKLGDPRHGVGLLESGLPDVDWVEIPDDGTWIYQDKAHAPLPTFNISRFPITYLQFQAILDDPLGFTDPRWWEGMTDLKCRRQNQVQAVKQWFRYANHPRESVSLYDAIAFCRWFSYKLGGEYALDNVMEWKVRLPIEEEWEKAARGTAGLFYPYGNNFDATKGNTDDTGIGRTSAVGMFPQGASPYGVLDMSGNVWEWCLSGYRSLKSGNPLISKDCVLRGGSWFSDQHDARATSRSNHAPNYHRSPYYGFRVVCSLPPVH